MLRSSLQRAGVAAKVELDRQFEKYGTSRSYLPGPTVKGDAQFMWSSKGCDVCRYVRPKQKVVLYCTVLDRVRQGQTQTYAAFVR